MWYLTLHYSILFYITSSNNNGGFRNLLEFLFFWEHWVKQEKFQDKRLRGSGSKPESPEHVYSLPLRERILHIMLMKNIQAISIISVQ